MYEYLPTTLLFVGFSAATFVYTLKNRKQKKEDHNFINEILISFLFLFSGVLFPFMFQFHSQNIPHSTLEFLWATTSLFLCVEMGVWFSILGINAVKGKRNPAYKVERSYESFCENFRKAYVYDFKKDVERKFLHLLPVFVIFFFWTLGTILQSLGFLAQFGLDNYSFAFWLIITVGFGFCAMFQIADLARLNRFYLIPEWAVGWFSKSMKPSELDTFVSSAPLVLSFVPFVFAPFPIFAAVSLITAGADAAASLIGKKYGKHKFFETSNKTIEGFLAGAAMTFLIVVFIISLYNPLMNVTVNIGIIVAMATMAAFLFFIIDAFAKNVTDNILNPLITGLGMCLFLFI